MKIKVFNSWHSDSAFNRKAISDALLHAKMELENKLDNINIEIIDSNSNETGSHHIPTTILKNISDSDIFVGDVSIVGKVFAGEKKLCNPNVIMELGYALNGHGWGRIITLFNKETGEFPNDLPFDIEKRSCIDFKMNAMQQLSNVVGQLKPQLIDRIREIIDKNPPKLSKRLDATAKRQRESDIGKLEEILTCVKMKQLDDFFSYGGVIVKQEFLDARYKILKVFTSKSFFISDELTNNLLKSFCESLSPLEGVVKKYYSHNRITGSYSTIEGAGRAVDFDETVPRTINQIDKAFDAFIDRVRRHYPEIDTNKFA